MSANNRTTGRSIFRWSPVLTVFWGVLSGLLAVAYWRLYESSQQRESLLRGEIIYLKSMKDRVEKKSYICLDNIDQLQKHLVEYKSFLADKTQDMTLVKEDNVQLERNLAVCKSDVAKLMNGSLVPVLFSN